ncbi:hypothetical protein EV189_3921 [Motilibacter rhizosphaerae]|uniref:DUF6457 domain-containing protein n=1 Tax=Motilibacter rhizosphaerae TaxID=598652 RepID=A0A4Q7NAZ7_9ACTN|nr:DUF6457 domain-containing protein [Motilibacter rhizosphaerae]RZS79051.1 hypothetical protein EV189_3921 [Motilibacter rhizosphaerae]
MTDAPEPAEITLDEWTSRVAAALGLSDELAALPVRQAILDLARDSAHGVARPAAPLTTFLAGVAVGLAGGDAAALDAAAATVRAELPPRAAD